VDVTWEASEYPDESRAGGPAFARVLKSADGLVLELWKHIKI
jgi:hypothetical protein